MQFTIEKTQFHALFYLWIKRPLKIYYQNSIFMDSFLLLLLFRNIVFTLYL